MLTFAESYALAGLLISGNRAELAATLARLAEKLKAHRARMAAIREDERLDYTDLFDYGKADTPRTKPRQKKRAHTGPFSWEWGMLTRSRAPRPG